MHSKGLCAWVLCLTIAVALLAIGLIVVGILLNSWVKRMAAFKGFVKDGIFSQDATNIIESLLHTYMSNPDNVKKFLTGIQEKTASEPPAASAQKQPPSKD